MPVTGSYDDGPEWGTQPYTNMFASDNGSVNPAYPVNTQIGDFLKAHGGTVARRLRLLASRRRPAGRPSARPSPSSTPGARSASWTRPSPSAAWTSPLTALVAKQKNINSMVPALDNNSNYALATSLAQAGVKLKAVLFATGYEPDIIGSPVWNDPAGRLLHVAVPTVVAAQRRHPADAGGACRSTPRFTPTQFPTFASTSRGPGPT